jgi:hypothetical protein
MTEPIFMKLGMYTMATNSISTGRFINTAHPCFSVYVSLVSLHDNGSGVCILSVLGNGFVNTFPRQRIQTTRGELLDASFCMLSVCHIRRMCGFVSPPSLLGNSSVNTFLLQRRIVGSILFYAVRAYQKVVGD